MEIQLLNDIVIIFGLSVGILLLCPQLRIPALVGFLVTGALAGPYGFGLIESQHEVEILAEVGVVLLLFTIGIEFSFKRLLEIRKAVLGEQQTPWPGTRLFVAPNPSGLNAHYQLPKLAELYGELRRATVQS